MKPIACLVLLASLAALAAGCGGGGDKQASSTTTQTTTVETTPTQRTSVTEKAYGQGARTVWVFRDPGQKPKALVVFFHGLGGQKETTPYHHRPWLRHLAEQGNVVFYPRFEKTPGAPGALRNALLGVKTTLGKVPAARLPVVVIGYSRGGGLGFDFTAIAPAIGLSPKAMLAVFPAMMDPKLDLRGILPGTRFVFLTGDEDSVVGSVGAQILMEQLAAVHYPVPLVKSELVRSGNGFVATHLSVLEVSPGARAAFWERADRLVSSVTQA